ncbi:unnamed protein product (macronuclear) [Paramecium tetraurelia]|uniref:RING-type domain-containing protein n=1 Tax=Paramecium tetraurelia TaxID=5888 RepID=A0BQ98_PARTE|nr:uncharacterized protein GSPATT00030944001 [Paramecium tetraurelia]CAK60715.1 unnamed protein product [Paramecium tetraurelia]|eukprot:XP_001428113.1 hypothetical protein (macronuclear) [Paramecium tetraurelia strain d4-2]
MNIYTIIEILKHTEQRGVELLIDALIIGIEIGRKNLQNHQKIAQIVGSLSNLKHGIDFSFSSPFLRDEIFDRVLNKNEKLEDILMNVQQQCQEKYQLQQQQTNNCNICSQSIENNSEKKFIAACQHQFHKQCVENVLAQGFNIRIGFKCPICGQSTFKEDIEYQLKANNNFKTSCCPTPQCKKYFSYIGQEIYRCSECEKKYCLKCQSQNHPINECKTDIKTATFEMGDNYKECPKCKLWVKQLEDEKILYCLCKYTFCFGCGNKDGNCNCNKDYKILQSLTKGFFQMIQ